MRFSEEATVGIIIILSIIGLFAGAISFAFWDENQIRVTYQTAYQKNIECRTDSSKSVLVYNIEKVCGPIPQFKDYQE